MIQNFIKTALRSIWKTKGYSFLNIFGLAIGIAAACIIFLWIENQLNFNNHFKNKKDIYIVKSIQAYDGVTYVMESTPGPLAPALEQEVAGIKHAARMTWSMPQLFSTGDKNLFENGIYADPSLADIYALKFLSGNAKTAFKDPNNVILTEALAKKIFGTEQALGKTIKINNNEAFIVSAVVEDIPKNSTLTFGWLIPFQKYEQKEDWLKTWGNNGVITLVQTEPNVALEPINKKILEFVINKTKGEVKFSKNMLYPMDRWVTYNNFDKNGKEIEGGIKNIRLFSIIAWIVLLIACINFMNLATARSEKRAKEVGLRKVVGASRTSLIFQFLSESMIMASVAMLIAVCLVYICIKPFNQLIDQQLEVNLFQSTHLLFLFGIMIICGLFAGSYPAFFLSSFKPLTIIKGGKVKNGLANITRKILVIIQYTASVVLIICTIIIYKQIQSNQNKDLGFDRNQVIMTAIQGKMGDHLPIIKNQLMATGLIEAIGASNMNILNIYSNASGFKWQGQDQNNSNVLIGILKTDPGFIPSMQLKMLDGRNFNDDLLGDSSSVIINETFAKMIKKDGLVAESIITFGDQTLKVAGVVKDFVYNNVYADPDPVVFIPYTANQGVLNIRTKAGIDLPKAIEAIKKIVLQNNPGFPFDYKFLDDTFNNKFKSEIFIQKLSSIFAIVSIIISCLGLFGLAAFATEQRSKEISIRKVLGASVTGLINMLNKDFILLVTISCIIAFPIAWYFMQKWLSDYAHHIRISWEIFAISGLLAILIALLTISSQALKAALANPSKTLRDE